MADLTRPAEPPSHTLRSRVAGATRLQSGILILLMALSIGAGIEASRRISASIDQQLAATAQARRRVTVAQEILTAVLDAETGQRGYFLTGNRTYLQPYDEAITKIEPLLSELKALTETLPALGDEPGQAQTFARAKFAELRQTLQMADRDGIPAAISLVNSGAGKATMDEVRKHIAIIIDRSETDRARRAERLSEHQRRITTLLVGGLAGAVVLLGGTAILLVLNRSRLLQARAGEQREAAQLQAAIEHIRDGVAVFDNQARLTLANARFAKALGIPPTLARPGTELDTLASAVSLDPPLLTGAQPNRPLIAEAREGRRTLEVWRSPMPGDGQMLSIADISRRVAAEEAARQSQKMEVLGQMTGGVAHDFNNLLQVVSANLELLRSRIARLENNAALLARLDAASSGVTRGARLTRHLLAFARRQPLAPEPIDAKRQLAGMNEVLRRTLGESIHFDCVTGPELWFMRADPSQFENALLNLALNARDAMTGPDGIPAGALIIEASNATLDDAYTARTTDVSPGQYVMFAVKDSGCGMTPDQLARATEPFYTTKAEGRGTGLGLPMVLGFAKQSGGHLQLCSEPGQGTTVRLYIPRSSAPAVRPEEPAPAALPLGQNELVLLVEDDTQVRQAARDALSDLGYQVIEADSADAALALLESGARPRLLFTDVVMPGEISARTLSARAKALIPGLPVLFTSGYTQNSIVHHGQLDPDVKLISKPWRRDQLGRAIRAALDDNTPRPRPRPRILLVEDDEMLRMTTADTLATLGYDVLEASTATAALTRLTPAPDLILADLKLPDQCGTTLTEEIHRRLPNTPVIIATAHPHEPNHGITWLDKPYDVQALRHALNNALERDKVSQL